MNPQLVTVSNEFRESYWYMFAIDQKHKFGSLNWPDVRKLR